MSHRKKRGEKGLQEGGKRKRGEQVNTHREGRREVERRLRR